MKNAGAYTCARDSLSTKKKDKEKMYFHTYTSLQHILCINNKIIRFRTMQNIQCSSSINNLYISINDLLNKFLRSHFQFRERRKL